MRYGEQIFEIDVPLDGLDWNAASIWSTRSTSASTAAMKNSTPMPRRDQEVVFVNARVAAVGEVSRRDEDAKADGAAVACKPQGTRKAWFGGWRDIPV